MPLADIIAAIHAQAEKEIAFLTERAKKEKESIHNAANTEIAVFEEDLQKKTQQRKEQEQKKADAETEMERKKMLLDEKRSLLDAVYTGVLEAVQKLPKAELAKLTEALEKKAKGAKGKMQAAKEGGFFLVSDVSEEDFSFPYLVTEVLRPQTESAVSAELFS